MSQLRKDSNHSSEERNQKFLRKLKFYSTAAGLGAFACTSAAQGAIQLFDVVDVSISNSVGQPANLFIDINPDGDAVPEFQIAAPANSFQIRMGRNFEEPTAGDPFPNSFCCIGTVTPGSNVLSAWGTPAGAKPADPKPGYYVESIPSGTAIGGVGSVLVPSTWYGVGMRFGAYPPPAYNNVRTGRYVGLEWDFDGTSDVRYGWARIDVTPDVDGTGDLGTATLFSYAFEMTPNTGLAAGSFDIVPEPTSLALLAAGGGGLALARRRRKS